MDGNTVQQQVMFRCLRAGIAHDRSTASRLLLAYRGEARDTYHQAACRLACVRNGSIQVGERQGGTSRSLRHGSIQTNAVGAGSAGCVKHRYMHTVVKSPYPQVAGGFPISREASMQRHQQL
jgi:hypothetical protein